MGICYIFGGGERTDCHLTFASDDMVIAADAGFDYLKDLGLRADVVLGDFDSLRSYDIPADSLRYPKEKDDTDMLLAIKYGLEHGYQLFHIYGGLGGRLDHTFANIQSLSYLASRGARGILWGGDCAIEVIKDGAITFSKNQKENKPGSLISVFSISDICVDVTISGLKYEIENTMLSNNIPLGISNEFTGKNVKIEVKKGTIAVLWHLS